jgi:hypothetical protein
LMIGRYGRIREQVHGGQLLQAWLNARSWGDCRDRALSRVLRYALQPSMIPKARFRWANGGALYRARTVLAEIRNIERGTASTPEVSLFNLFNETGLVAPILPVEMRYPFLDRTLVEYSLGLAAPLKTKGPVDKSVLRGAMKDLLPAQIITRVQKTGFGGIHALSVVLNWHSIERWLQRPIVTELGVLACEGLRELALGLRDGNPKKLTEAMIALSAEAWLQGRAARPKAHRQRQLASENFSLGMGGEEVQT